MLSKSNLEIEMFDQIETENTLHQIVSRSWNVIDHSKDLGRERGWLVFYVVTRQINCLNCLLGSA